MKENSIPSRSARTLLVYWGNFGGGVRIANNLLSIAERDDLDIYFSFSRNSEGFKNSYYESSKLFSFLVATPRNKYLNINVFLAFYFCFKILFQIRRKKIKQIVILMPHPWDFLLEVISHFAKIKVLRCLHDATSHPGDKYLPNWYIKLLSRTSTANVFFSKSVASHFVALKKRAIIVKLFDLNAITKYSREENSILFIGRIKEYKGLRLLSEAWEKLNTSSLTLRISGHGEGIPEFLTNNAIVTNRWLTEQEVTQFIGSSKVLVLPYLSASQSGLIPIAESLGTVVVVTPLKGLIEQLSDGASHIICKDFSATSLAEAILLACKLPNIEIENSRQLGLRMLKEFGAID